ncbi:MAG: M50 family metallopeptidase [Polyangia bacterium]
MHIPLPAADLGTFLLAVLALGILIVVHEGGHYLMARWSGMRVDRFSIGLGPKIIGFRHGETEFQIGCIPFGGFVQIAGLNPGEEGIAPDDPRSYPNRPAYQRLATIFAGPATNYVFAALVMVVSCLVWGVPEQGTSPLVGGFVKGKPAETSGLVAGDEIVGVDGHVIADVKDVPALISATAGREFKMDIVRDGKPMSYSMKAAPEGTEYRLGIQLDTKDVRVKKGIGETLAFGVGFPIRYSGFILDGFAKIFSGRQKAEFSGPLGILTVMKKQIEHGPRFALEIVAIISVYLGLFNLLPIPALDGSRMAFIGYEMVAKRRISENTEQRIHGYGMMVLLAFMLIVTFGKDIPKLFGH